MRITINHSMRRKRHKQVASERRQGGMAMVEFALLFPIQLFFILAILEIALIQVGRLMVSYAAYCAAHAELMGQDPTEAAVIALIPLCDEEPETVEYPGPDIDITGEPPQPGTGFNFPGWGEINKWEDARRRVYVTRLVDSSSDVLNRSTIQQEIWEPLHANSIVQHNIGGHEHRIAYQSVVYVMRLHLHLFLEGGYSQQPTQRGHHAEQSVQFHNLGHVGLDKEDTPVGIKPSRQPVKYHLVDILLQCPGILQRGQSVNINDTINAVIFFLQLDVILYGSQVVT